MYRSSLLYMVLLVCMQAKAQLPVDTIADQELNEVVVVAKLPVLEMKADRVVYHMESSVVRNQGNLFEVLQTLPGVVVHTDGSIFMNGQSGVNVLIDGKQTYLSGQELVSLLQSMPAATADKIDMIAHPSARYDASGNSGLIDIHTKKIKLRGMNLSTSGNFAQGRNGSGYGSASLNRRDGRFNFYLTYSYYQGTTSNDLQTYRPFTALSDPDKPLLIMDQYSYSRYPNSSHYYRAGIDFFASSRTTIGLSTSGNLRQDKTLGDMKTYFAAPQSAISDSMLNTLTVQDRNRKNFSGGINLTHRFDSIGKTLDASFDYLHFGYKATMHQHSSLQTSATQIAKIDSLRGNTEGGIQMYTGQINVTLPLANDWKVEAGAKTSFVSIDNEALYANRIQGEWLPDRALSQRFMYDENIHAGYIQGSATFNMLHITGGLRVENTQIKGRQLGGMAAGNSSFTSRYTDLFPTLLLEYSLPDGKWSLFYGKRIVRPNYGDLNPFVYIFDEYTYEQGNTALKPEKTDNIEVAYALKELLKVAFGFSHTRDVIMKSYTVNEGKRVFVSPMNLSTAFSMGPRIHTGNLSLTSFWEVNANAALIYNRYKWAENQKERMNKQTTLIAGLSNQFRLGKGWGMELSGSYNGKMAVGQGTLSPFWQVNGGVQKKVLKDKGTISLFARDLFQSLRQKMELDISGQRAIAIDRQDNTVVGISFSYRFSKGFEVKESRRKNSMDESKRINL